VSLWVAEPPAAYATRLPAVVDCSVIAAALFAEAAADEAVALTAAFHLHAPALIAYELCQVAMTKLRRGEAAAGALQAQLVDFEAAAIELCDVSLPAVLALAQRYGLSADDASYLWLAAELRAPLVTFDRRLGLAAQEHMNSLGAP
jgi:predicted nucleic acid-binding protein